MGADESKEEEEERELENDNITMLSQNHMNPTFLSDVVHAIPHVNFDFDYIPSDYFDPRSGSYNAALFIIGMWPILMAAAGLLAVYAYRKYKHRYGELCPNTNCICALQRLYRYCAWLIFLALILDILLHFTVHFKFRALYIPESSSFIDFQTEEMEKVTKMKVTPYTRFYDDNYFYLRDIEDLYEVYKAAMLRVVDAAARVGSPQLQPRLAHTPLKQYVIMLEWLRFAFSMVVWGMALAIIVWFRKRLIFRLDSEATCIKCAVCGVVFAAIMAMYLIIFAVAIADFCQLPNQTVRVIRPKLLTAYYLRAANRHYCESFRHAMYASMKDFLWQYREAKRIVYRDLIARADIIEFKRNARELDNSWPGTSQNPTKYLRRREYGEDLYKLFNEIDTLKVNGIKMDWHKKIVCDDAVRYYDQPEDLRPLCNHNNVLFYLLLQFLIMMATMILFILILFLLTARLPRIIEKKTHT